MMPMVPPPPVPVTIRAPVGLLDRPSELGGARGGGAGRRRGKSRRDGAEADTPTHERSDEDCTHVILLGCRGAPTERLPSLTFGDRVLRSEIRPTASGCIRRSAPRQIAPYRDDKRHWRKSRLRIQNRAWLNHSSLVHGPSWH